MPRLSIDISDSQHQQLKATAALKGLSIKDFVLERTLSDTLDLAEMSEQQALTALRNAVGPALERARRGEFIEMSMKEIIARGKERSSR